MSKTSKTEQASVFRSVYSWSKIVMYCFWYRLYYLLIATQNIKKCGGNTKTLLHGYR